MSPASPLVQMVRKLRTRVTLAATDEAAILALSFTDRGYEMPAYLVREGASPLKNCSFLASGFAIRYKLTAEGARQIVALALPGDFIDLPRMGAQCRAARRAATDRASAVRIRAAHEGGGARSRWRL